MDDDDHKELEIKQEKPFPKEDYYKQKLIDWEEHTRLEEIARKQKEIDDAKAKKEEEARLEEERLALLPEEEREAILLEKA